MSERLTLPTFLEIPATGLANDAIECQRTWPKKILSWGESSRREGSHISAGTLKTAKWQFAADIPVSTELGGSRVNEAQTSPPENSRSLITSASTIETRLQAVERIPSAGRGQPGQFVPIRFIYRNKLTKDDKLLLAFDAFVLSEMLGRAVSLGKIIHGDDCVTLKVKTPALAGEVRKCLGKITALLASTAPPDLILNGHCAECEFQSRCRKIALEKDDLSLLAGMSAKERQKLRSKGIFTVTQLSYTFRPRRRPKRQRDKREKYHHSLKALAIREQKIHVVGTPDSSSKARPSFWMSKAYRTSLFAFLELNGIPWNNNAAERALRHLAVQRKIPGAFSQRRARLYSAAWGCAVMQVSREIIPRLSALWHT